MIEYENDFILQLYYKRADGACKLSKINKLSERELWNMTV